MSHASGSAPAPAAAAAEAHMAGSAAWRISIDGLQAQACVGMYTHEYGQAQPVTVDVKMEYRQAVGDDGGAPPVDYDRYCNMISGFLQQRAHARLLETLAADIASLSFETLPAITGIEVSLHKPGIRSDAARLAVSMAWRRQDYLAHLAATAHCAGRFSPASA